MHEPFLLSRVLLRFQNESEDLRSELSAAAITPDGSLWLGSDEFNSLERLSIVEPFVFGDHQPFAVNQFIPLFNQEDEIDIEGLDYSHSYLWVTGSHSPKRKKPKGKGLEKDLERLAEVSTELNRYLIARMPISEGNLVQTCAHATKTDKTLTAARLQTTEDGNILTEALKQDPHLGAYINPSLPSKENGFDIEGLAVHKDRLFLGLRGPVLRGWSVILEIQVEELEDGVLGLKAIGKNGELYRKHFVDLDGLGVRELCFWKGDLLILAGPTMVLEGAMRVFRLKHPLDHDTHSITDQDSHRLEVLFDFPFAPGGDRAEGLALLSCFGEPGLLVVYDTPHEVRKVGADSIFADIFRLPNH